MNYDLQNNHPQVTLFKANHLKVVAVLQKAAMIIQRQQPA